MKDKNNNNVPDSCWHRNRLKIRNLMLHRPQKKKNQNMLLMITLASGWLIKKSNTALSSFQLSPASNAKKLFCKLVANDFKNLTIIECVIEMKSSVEKIKDMILNNCI